MRLKEDTGEIHDTEPLLELAMKSGTKTITNTGVPSDVLKVALSINPREVFKRYRKLLHPDARARLRQRRIYGPFTWTINGQGITYPGDDRSEIIWAIGCEVRRAGATPAEILALLFSTIFWKSREVDGKAEDPERLAQRLFDADIEQVQPDVSEKTDLAIEQQSSLLSAIDPSEWEGLPIPVRQWIIENWIPRLKTTLVFGDGGTGKTLLMIMLSVACAMGINFLGKKVAQGRVYAFLGENDDQDTHITLNDVCNHYGIQFADLKGKVRFASRASFDNVLMHFGNGEGEHTELFEALVQDVVSFDADLIIIETAADLFGGNENIRSEVRQFITRCCEHLAIAANAAVVLCAHPSMSGIKSGDGSSGSTAWNNSARSRLYLHRVIDDKGYEVDPNRRVLSRKKSNFAQLGASIDMYWENGVFVSDVDAEKRQATSKLDTRIIDEIGGAFDSGTPWSAHHQSNHRHFINWMTDSLHQTKHAAKKQLGRLLTDGTIVEVEYDPHLHKKGLCTPEQAAKLARNGKAK